MSAEFIPSEEDGSCEAFHALRDREEALFQMPSPSRAEIILQAQIARRWIASESINAEWASDIALRNMLADLGYLNE